MNSDPVFSYNPGLPDYPNLHEATLTYHCGSYFSKDTYSSATLLTPAGLKMEFSATDANAGTWSALSLPYSMQIQTLREVGDPEIVVDNSDAIRGALGGGGCSANRRTDASTASAMALLLGGASLLLLRRRNRGTV